MHVPWSGGPGDPARCIMEGSAKAGVEVAALHHGPLFLLLLPAQTLYAGL